MPIVPPPPGNWTWKCPACGEETSGNALIKLREILTKMRRDTIEECAQTVEIIRQGAKVLPRELVVSRIRALAPPSFARLVEGTKDIG